MDWTLGSGWLDDDDDSSDSNTTTSISELIMYGVVVNEEDFVQNALIAMQWLNGKSNQEYIGQPIMFFSESRRPGAIPHQGTQAGLFLYRLQRGP